MAAQAPSHNLPMTVGEVLKIISHVRVIAGSSGMERIVHSVTIMDSPEIASWLQGGEFLLVNGYFLRDDPDSAQRLIRDAAGAGAAAIGIKLQRFIETIPKEAVDEAERTGLPLIEMPRDIAWKTIIDPVYKNLCESHEQILVQSNEAFRTFNELVRKGKGPQDILAKIRKQVSRGVWLLDAGFSPQLYPPDQGLPPSLDFRKVYEQWRTGGSISMADQYDPCHPLHSLAVDAHRILLPQEGQSSISRSYLVARISVSIRRSAFLAISESEGMLSEQQLAFVLQAREVLSILLTRSKALLEEEVTKRNRFLFGILKGEAADASTISEARRMGWDLSKPYRVMAIDTGEPLEMDSAELRLLDRISSKRAFGTNLVHSDGETVLLVPVSAKEQRNSSSSLAAELAMAVQRAQSEQLRSRHPWSFGIGRVAHAISELPASYSEAKRCLEVGMRVRGPGTVGTLQELAVYVLLDRLRSSDECQEQIGQFLTILERHDAQFHSDLLETLQVFLASPGGVQEAATHLYVHRNTVRLRLAKIQELLGLSLNNPDNRLVLDILLRIRRLSRPPETLV